MPENQAFILPDLFPEITHLKRKITAIGVANGQVRLAFEQAKRYFFVMVDDGVFADPIEGGHELVSLLFR